MKHNIILFLTLKF